MRNKIPERDIWCGMIYRCTSPRAGSWSLYGARGITVCERWRSDFSAFLSDMGPRPSMDHSLDRIDNDGNYEPGNCRWATRSEQSNNRRTNRRLTHDGETLTVSEWAQRIGIGDGCIKLRLDRGASVAEALTAPLHVYPSVSSEIRAQILARFDEGASLRDIGAKVGHHHVSIAAIVRKSGRAIRDTKPNRILTHNGDTRPLGEWAKVAGIKAGTLSARLGRGWGMERALGFAALALVRA